MIGKQYKAHKDNVIDLYNNYKIKRADLDDGIDIKFLGSRIESLRKGKFMLTVAGEVEAGKSTFINALLGAEILPSDVSAFFPIQLSTCGLRPACGAGRLSRHHPAHPTRSGGLRKTERGLDTREATPYH